MDYQNKPQTIPATFVKTISIIHIALFIGQFLFTVVALSIIPQKGVDIKNTKDIFVYIVPLVAAVSFIASIFIFNQQLNTALNKSTLKDKLMAYQTALIQRYAFLNGSSMFAIVAYMQSCNLLFIIIAAILSLYFLFLRPTKDKIQTDLNLSYEDKIEMGN